MPAPDLPHTAIAPFFARTSRHAHHPPSLSARFPLFAPVCQGPHGGRACGQPPSGRAFLEPATAALAPRGHGDGRPGYCRLAARLDGGGGLVAGRLLCQLGGPAGRLPPRAAESRREPGARPGAPPWRTDGLARPAGTLLLP